MKFADGHSDFLSKALVTSPERWNKLASSPEKLKRAGVIFQVYAIFVDSYSMPAKKALAQIQIFRSLDVKKVLSKGDLPDEKSKDLHVLLSLEGLLPVDGRPEMLEIFHDLGVRMASLVWSRVNSFADGSVFKGEGTGRGLTPLGFEALEVMERLGWILDVSHLNDEGVKDVFKAFDGVIVASHSDARALCNIERNIPDEFIEEIAKRGGIVGVNFSPRFLTCKGEKAKISDVIRHIEHIAKIAGVDHVGLGSDFDGLSSYPEGLEDALGLKKLGTAVKEVFGEKDAEKILYKNWIRVVAGGLKKQAL